MDKNDKLVMLMFDRALIARGRFESMKYTALAPLLLIAACNSGEVNLTNASVEDVAKATSNVKKLTPGEWTNTTEIVSVDMPGIPAEQKEMMKSMSAAMIGKKTEVKNCITPEKAAKPTPEMFGAANKNCEFESFKLTAGVMDAVMTCADQAKGGSMKMTMKGQYGGETYAMETQVAMEPGAGVHSGMAMLISAKSSGKRTGECSPASKG
jgi:Protein of unknown function (DUF3617)